MPSIYKSLVQDEIILEDVRDIDPQLFKILNNIRYGVKEGTPDGIENLCMVFGAMEWVDKDRQDEV